MGEGDDAVTYDIHGDLAEATPDRPALFMFATPMDAAAFGPMAGLFTDRPVVTYDPRGAGRNPTGTPELTPEHHAEDLHRVISALGVGPVDVFGSILAELRSAAPTTSGCRRSCRSSRAAGRTSSCGSSQPATTT